MIPTPKLDDRTFQDIVDEALRLIPQYCPDWTNYNPSDPGVTLIELFAWMMDMVLYRLNRVPQKNYLAFLDLIGLRLNPPQPARIIATFKPASHVESTKVPIRTLLSTMPAEDGSTVVFETTDDLLVINNSIDMVFSQYGRKLTDHSSYATTGLDDGFDPFAGTVKSQRYLYLGSPSFADFKKDRVVRLAFELPHEHAEELFRILEWSVWDGVRWVGLDPDFERTDMDGIVLPGRRQAEKLEVNGIESYWLRASLSVPPSNMNILKANSIKVSLITEGEGDLPDALYSEETRDAFVYMEPQRTFRPFGKQPGEESAFYIKADGPFSHRGALLRLDFQLKPDAPQPVPSEDLTLRWEYLAENKWNTLAIVFPAQGVVDEKGNFNFEDDTAGFTKSGIVSFVIPHDMSVGNVNGEEGLWLRVRIEKGDYGVPGEYMLEGDLWVWKEERPLRPPVMSSLRIRFHEEEHPVENVISENDGVFTDLSDINVTAQGTFDLFQTVQETSPALYIGFAKPLPNDEIQIYFKVKEDDVNDIDSVFEEEQIVVWEYFAGDQWKNLFPVDGTRNFTRSGFLRFLPQPDFVRTKRLGKSLYFIRARLQMGGYVKLPRIQRIMLNSVLAENAITYAEYLLGGSDGTPDQEFKMPKGPVLPGQEVWVLFPDMPAQKELEKIIAEEGEDAVQQVKEGWLIRWHEVDDLYASDGLSMHYVKDDVAGVIRFGDGVHGMIPPKGDKNVRLRNYRIGGGDKGNVPAGAVTVLKVSLPQIEAVTNPYPGEGGADAETVEELKKRAPFVIRNRGRAVTAEDFEWIARGVSTEIARVKVFPCKEREGEVMVIVVPRRSKEAEEFSMPVASSELLERVKRRLNATKVIGTKIKVRRPKYRDLKITITVVRDGTVDPEEVKNAVSRSIRAFLDPLIGDKKHGGWPFGKTVNKLDLYHAVEGVPGVEFVESIGIFDIESGKFVEKLILNEDELPFVQIVDITEKTLEMVL